MQEIGTIEGVVAPWISKTIVRYWPIRSELMLYKVGRSVSVPPPLAAPSSLTAHVSRLESLLVMLD
jgi:hypothetical protein